MINCYTENPTHWKYSVAFRILLHCSTSWAEQKTWWEQILVKNRNADILICLFLACNTCCACLSQVFPVHMQHQMGFIHALFPSRLCSSNGQAMAQWSQLSDILSVAWICSGAIYHLFVIAVWDFYWFSWCGRCKMYFRPGRSRQEVKMLATEFFFSQYVLLRHVH